MHRRRAIVRTRKPPDDVTAGSTFNLRRAHPGGAAGTVKPLLSGSSNDPPVRVERVPLEELLPRRLALLRPPGSPAEPPKPGDLHPQAAHLGVREDGHLVAFASIHPTDIAGEWQLRAVATDPAARGAGLGRAVVEACLAHARGEGATRAWCHGRLGARGFYERLGFSAVGDAYEVPVTGPHLRMEIGL